MTFIGKMPRGRDRAELAAFYRRTTIKTADVAARYQIDEKTARAWFEDGVIVAEATDGGHHRTCWQALFFAEGQIESMDEVLPEHRARAAMWPPMTCKDIEAERNVKADTERKAIRQPNSNRAGAFRLGRRVYRQRDAAIGVDPRAGGSLEAFARSILAETRAQWRAKKAAKRGGFPRRRRLPKAA